MKIVSTTLQQLLVHAPTLDPIRVVLEDLEPRKGRITLSCFDQAWTAYWGGMGDRTMAQFFARCSPDYLVRNLKRGIRHSVVDWEAVPVAARRAVCAQRRAGDLDADTAREHFDDIESADFSIEEYGMHRDLMHAVFGDDWWHALPEKPNTDYVWLASIVEAVQQALREHTLAPVDDTMRLDYLASVAGGKLVNSDSLQTWAVMDPIGRRLGAGPSVRAALDDGLALRASGKVPNCHHCGNTGKSCQMNCGLSAGDQRNKLAMRVGCDDCLPCCCQSAAINKLPLEGAC